MANESQQITENVVTDLYLRVLKDKDDYSYYQNEYDLLSPWTKAEDVKMLHGGNLQEKMDELESTLSSTQKVVSALRTQGIGVTEKTDPVKLSKRISELEKPIIKALKNSVGKEVTDVTSNGIVNYMEDAYTELIDSLKLIGISVPEGSTLSAIADLINAKN